MFIDVNFKFISFVGNQGGSHWEGASLGGKYSYAGVGEQIFMNIYYAPVI